MNVAEQAGKTEEYSHSFFMKVKQMVDNGDSEQISNEKIHLKLLRLCSHA
jgi:hypothetical protein